MKFDKDPSVGEAGEFLKLESGKSVVGVFRGDPHEFNSSWKDGKSAPCEASEKGAKFRFRINFITKNEAGEYKALIWEQGAVVYNQLKSFNDDYPLEKTIVKLTRQGTKLDTTYSLLPNPGNHVVNEATEAILAAIPLADLTQGLEIKEAPLSNGAHAPMPPMPEQHEELPF